jgi:nitrite reductase (NADH) large subunit
VRRADALATVETRAEALTVATAFLQYYREHAAFKERTYDFVPRVGLDKLREEVLGERSGARLRERFALAKAAAARDPWLERDEPYHPRQFTDSDPTSAEEREPAVVGPPAGGEL